MYVTSVNYTQHTEVSPPYPVHVALAGCPRLVEVTWCTSRLVYNSRWLQRRLSDFYAQ